MPTDPVIINERIAIILGVVTLTLGIAAFASCKTCFSIFRRFGWGNPLDNKGYRLFFRYHSYYWWAFGIVLISHIFIAFVHTGLPQAGDPGAWIHWVILSLGLVTALSAGVQFFSCRICFKFLSRQKSSDFFNNRTLQPFFKFHSYYWIIFFLLAFVHFAAGYYHAGIWPV